MPKTGGQSIKQLLRDNLTEHYDFINLATFVKKKQENKEIIWWTEKQQTERDKAIIVFGHAVNKDTQKLFSPEFETRHLVVFREPAKLLVSLYNYTFRFVEKPPSFWYWHMRLMLRGNQNWQVSNFYKHFLKKNKFSAYFLPHYSFFEKKLQAFWYVGVTERINVDFKNISKFLELKNNTLTEKNVSSTFQMTKKHLELNPSLRTKLNKTHSLDFKIYQYALKREVPNI